MNACGQRDPVIRTCHLPAIDPQARLAMHCHVHAARARRDGPAETLDAPRAWHGIRLQRQGTGAQWMRALPEMKMTAVEMIGEVVGKNLRQRITACHGFPCAIRPQVPFRAVAAMRNRIDHQRRNLARVIDADFNEVAAF
jgi:hypothetical protein